MKKDILLLVGLSGSGKDYLMNNLVYKFNWHRMVSYTTRPMRDSETEGVEYHFIKTNEEFEQLCDSGTIFERTEYLTNKGLWLYGFGKDSLPTETNVTSVAICNPDGVKQFLESELRDRIAVVYIEGDNETRLLKIADRYDGIENMSLKHKGEAFEREIRDGMIFKAFRQELTHDDINWSEVMSGIHREFIEHYYGGVKWMMEEIRIFMNMEVI